LQQTGSDSILAHMRIVDPETGRSYVEKRRVRYNEPGQPRELTFSCYRHYAFLGRDRTREWFCAALDEARTEFAFQLWAYVVMGYLSARVLWVQPRSNAPSDFSATDFSAFGPHRQILRPGGQAAE
jgi:hypothetical protein